jgi:acyl carrier protein
VSSSSSSSNSNTAEATLERHFPQAIRDAYREFKQTKNADSADVVVLGVVVDHVPGKKLPGDATTSDKLSLIGDLGFDSVAITEMVFFLEDLFSVRISNEEILSVRTLGDLRSFVRRKVAVTTPAATQ